ncbi:MAG TPA: hypothetical protein VK658_10855 [Chryseolinea sp.]|nr:hypothetical protein [Chryseolinea sp.]
MKKYKVLYIDDSAEVDKSLLEPTIEDVERASLKITPELPKHWDEMVKDLDDRMDNFDCLILDWRLNERPIAGGKRVNYKASEVAQYVRRRVVEGEINKPIPIFLWSTDKNLKSSFYGDITSQDLFDETYKKDTDLSDFPLEKGKEMRCFIEAYEQCRLYNGKFNFAFLKALLNPFDESYVDERVAKYISNGNETSNKQSRVFPLIKLLYKDIVRTPGMLVSEDLLAIRLGIDITKSKDWKALMSRSAFKNIKYNGLFGSVHDRYWMQGLYALWANVGDSGSSLITLSAEAKVKQLKTFFKLKAIKALAPSDFGAKYWVLDEATELPLDLNLAELVTERDPLPWQERRYRFIHS